MNVAPAVSNDNQLFPVEPTRVVPQLRDVSETMLWALHNRATEAGRHDAVLTDPDSIRIHRLMDYDFARRFGDPLGSLAARGAEIDQALRQWLLRHPDGFVVSLGEGLETQVRRVDNGTMRWLSVDLPDAISLREQFLPPTDRFRHVAASALDRTWMDQVDASSGVFIVAQGLLMYLRPEMVHDLFCSIADRFPAAELVFDVVPRWFSRLTMIGLNQTPHYQLPPMPWGIDRDEVEPTLRQWHPNLASVTILDYRAPRGLLRLWEPMARLFPRVQNERPSLIQVKIGTAPRDFITGHFTTGRFTTGLSANRTNLMTLNTAVGSPTGTINDMLALAKQTADSSSDLAMAAGQIIAKRVALGVAAAVNPLAADHAEFARMVPEKVEAFSAAGKAMFEQSEEARSRIARLASDEVMTTARATIEMATCCNPVAAMQAQSRFARAWFERTASNFMTLGMMALTAQAAALEPLQLAVAANTERLG